MTAQINQEVGEVMQTWNDHPLSPRDLEDAFAARAKTIEDIIDS
jgi:hypothetical protein